MGKFIVKIIWFTLPILAVFILGFFLPPTPRSSQSLIFAEPQKDSLLRYVQSPRIIFVGGSNLSFGLNSQMIHDSLGLNPINTAIIASLGLKYMMDHTMQYIKNGDIVVIVPEYSHFYRKHDVISEELLRTVVDVNKSNYKLLNLKQKVNFIPFIPQFSSSKLNPIEYFGISKEGIYGVHSFNRYGDAYKHWELEKKTVAPIPFDGNINTGVMQGISKFQTELSAKGAALLVSYPSFQESSFLKSTKAIEEIESLYIKNGFTLLGTPQRYMMPDSFMFDTNYHLNKEGVDYRTELLIDDLREYLKTANKGI